MKKIKILTIAMTLITLATAFVAAQGQGELAPRQMENIQTLNIDTSDELTAEEVEGLLLMREEEKLARDVYLTLNEIWNLRTFEMIAGSEQQHMDAVAVILNAYDLEDPVTDDTIGAFTDSELDALYDQLVAAGSKSIEDALVIGATIEDLDIRDLQELIDGTDNEAIISVYENLLAGSGNHIRSFISQLDRYGEQYSPQYITEGELNAILNNESVAANGMGSSGFGLARGGARGQGSWKR